MSYLLAFISGSLLRLLAWVLVTIGEAYEWVVETIAKQAGRISSGWRKDG